MNLTVMPGLLAAGISVVIALAALIGKSRTVAHWSFAAGFVLLCFESLLTALSLQAVGAEDVLFWQRLSIVSTSFLPGTWLLFSLTYSRGNYRQFLRSWRWLLIVSFLLPFIVLVGWYKEIISNVAQPHSSSFVLVLGWPGK